MKYHILPFYFPTTCFFVDDSLPYLKNISLQLDKSIAYRLFSSPGDALIEINAQANMLDRTLEYFSKYKYVDEFTYTSHVINIDLDKIHRCIYDEKRYETASVVVVDFAMPEMNGLEFCRNIKAPEIRKILLTGQADEKLAVRAFNEGLIDRFIMKNDYDALSNLNQAIAELQRGYFEKISVMLSDALSVGTHRFLRDPAFAAIFKDISNSLNIIEFYLYSNPDGLLMLDASGAGTLLVIYTEKELQAQCEIAFEQGAPDILLSKLKSGQSVPYFWETGGHYRSGYMEWLNCMYPAQEFKGKEWYHYALVKNPAPFKLETVLSYHEFLDQLDERHKT